MMSLDAVLEYTFELEEKIHLRNGGKILCWDEESK
jgi:hypothetical protein